MVDMKTSIPKLHSIKWKTGVYAPNVTCLQSRTRESIPTHDVLMGAMEDGLRDVVVFGYDHDGYEHVYGSITSPKDAAYMFARGHLKMLRLSDD